MKRSVAKIPVTHFAWLLAVFALPWPPEVSTNPQGSTGHSSSCDLLCLSSVSGHIIFSVWLVAPFSCFFLKTDFL